jgi:hypothetical protein
MVNYISWCLTENIITSRLYIPQTVPGLGTLSYEAIPPLGLVTSFKQQFTTVATQMNHPKAVKSLIPLSQSHKF